MINEDDKLRAHYAELNVSTENLTTRIETLYNNDNNY